MSCIVGLVDEGTVWIGADSASASDDWEVRVTALPKVFKRGQFLIGYTTSFRMGQLLEHRLEVREREEGESDHAYMVNGFVEGVRECLKEGGWMEIEKSREEGGQFLVGYAGHLYAIYQDFQVNEAADGLDAIGCGRFYALGALFASGYAGPYRRVEEALEAATYFSGGVMAPFRIEKI